MLQRQHIMLKRWMTTVAQNAFEKYVTINDFLQNSKAYREFIQISKMELFAKKVNNFQPLTIFGKSSIWDVRVSSQCASGHTRFFYISNTFTGNPRLKLAKNWAKAKQHTICEFSLFGNYLLSSSTLLSKYSRRYSKKCTWNKCVY